MLASYPQDGGALDIRSAAGKTIAHLSMRKGRGYLELNDAEENKMVEAGSLDAGKGYSS
jgi:hypothetical protein